MKVAIVGLCVLMTITAFYGLSMLNSISEASDVFVALYLFVFALMLFGFEIVEVYPCQALDFIYRRNFGFMYGAKGKAFFIIL
jgi:hypothetical protein